MSVEAKPGELWIQVKDTGVGISDEDKGRIFEIRLPQSHWL
ncbi:MAG: hypothetical protein ACOCNC_13620 [Acetivibrio ethanolgignens]